MKERIRFCPLCGAGYKSASERIICNQPECRNKNSILTDAIVKLETLGVGATFYERIGDIKLMYVKKHSEEHILVKHIEGDSTYTKLLPGYKLVWPYTDLIDRLKRSILGGQYAR